MAKAPYSHLYVAPVATAYGDPYGLPEDVPGDILPESINSSEAVSEPELFTMANGFIPTSIDSQEVVSSDVIVQNNTVYPEAIETQESVSNASVIDPIYADVDSVVSEESVSEPLLKAILHFYPTGIASAQAFDSVIITRTVNVLPMYDSSDVSPVRVSLMHYVDSVDDSAAVSDPRVNYVDYCPTDSIGVSDVVNDVSITTDAMSRPTSIVTREVFGNPEVGANAVIGADSCDAKESVSRVYLHNPISNISIGDGSEVSDIHASVHVPPVYPITILSGEQFNNPQVITEDVVYSYAISSGVVVGNVSLRANNIVEPISIDEATAFGAAVYSSTTTTSLPASIASVESVSDLTNIGISVPPKSLDVLHSDDVIPASTLYKNGEVKRVYNAGSWSWDFKDSYWHDNYMFSQIVTGYWTEKVTDKDTGYVTYEPRSEDITYLKEIYRHFSYDVWRQLIEIHQLPAHILRDGYYGALDDWLLFGRNIMRQYSSVSSGTISVYENYGSWHTPISEIDSDNADIAAVPTNLSVIDDKIAELRGTTPRGITAASTPQVVYATVAAVTSEATDSFTAVAEYTIEDQVANYDLYEGISVSPMFNFMIDVPEPSYIKGVPTSPAMRTEPMCSVDIINPSSKIGKDSSGKLNFFGVAPDILGGTDINYDLDDDLPETLYNPLKPPYLTPEDPTSEWQEPPEFVMPELTDGSWGGWVPEEEDAGDEEEEEDPDEDWDETEDGVTPTGPKMKAFPLNLFGGGTVILSGIPKYKLNGKKKWLFVTGKKKKKKGSGDECVDENIDDGPRYIGLYFRNGHLVLTDGEYVLRTKAPPRGQTVLVFAGYYGDRSFVGWWKSPKKYKYRYGELGEKSKDRQGVTILKIGRGWGIRQPGQDAGNGFTIGSIKIIDETGEVGDTGDSGDDDDTRRTPSGGVSNPPGLRTAPTKTLEAFAFASVNTPSEDDDAKSDPWFRNPGSTDNENIVNIIVQMNELRLEMRTILKNLEEYPDMPLEEKSKANARLQQISVDLHKLDDARVTEERKNPPKWVQVDVNSPEYAEYMRKYNEWKLQPRMIGYFSIDDTSRVGVPGVR